MSTVFVNLYAILACAVMSIFLGSIWYGPLFGEIWMKLVGIKKPEKITKEMKMSMMRSYGLMFLGSLLMAFVLGSILLLMGASSVSQALMTAGFVWIGFVAPSSIGVVLFEGKPWRLWFLNSGYMLVQLCLMAIVLQAWK